MSIDEPEMRVYGYSIEAWMLDARAACHCGGADPDGGGAVRGDYREQHVLQVSGIEER